MPHYYATADKDGEELAQAIDEERRLLYVAMTRAKESLALTRARTRLTWGVARQMEASRFLDEIPDDLRRDVRVAAPPSSRSHRRRWSSSRRRSDAWVLSLPLFLSPSSPRVRVKPRDLDFARRRR